MLLQNMTPEEKLRQVSRLELDVRDSGRSWVEHNQRLLKKHQTYPYTHVISREYKGMGRWNIVLNFPEKPVFRKGVFFSTRAYQKFYVEKAAKAENIGAGIYLLGGSQENRGVGGGTSLYEYSPHFFLRYRQRYIDRYHISVSNFEDVIMSAIESLSHTMCMSNSVKLDKEDNDFLRMQGIPRLDGYDNLVLFTRHGIVFGLSRGNYYECFLTYVSREDFYEGQKGAYSNALKLYELHDRFSKADPYYFIDRDSLRKSVGDSALSRLLNNNF